MTIAQYEIYYWVHSYLINWLISLLANTITDRVAYVDKTSITDITVGGINYEIPIHGILLFPWGPRANFSNDIFHYVWRKETWNQLWADDRASIPSRSFQSLCFDYHVKIALRPTRRPIQHAGIFHQTWKRRKCDVVTHIPLLLHHVHLPVKE